MILIRRLQHTEAVLLEFIHRRVHLRAEHLEAKMTAYRAYIVGLHSRSIGVVNLDCADDDAAITSAGRLVEKHDIELWQMNRPVARFDAESKQIFRK
jgi:hypothetical protein